MELLPRVRDGVVLEPCDHQFSRQGEVSDVRNRPAASKRITRWGSAAALGHSKISYGCGGSPSPAPRFNVAEFTLRLELKANSWSSSPYPYLIDTGNPSIVLHGLGWVYGSTDVGKIYCDPYLASGEGEYARGGVNLKSDTQWSTGAWHTLVVRKTQTQLCLFKNGAADGCRTFTAADIRDPGHLQLAGPGTAKYQDANNYTRFDGELRNLEIFPCALYSPMATEC